MTDSWVPPTCTLPTVDQPLRQAEFDELFRTAVRSVHRPERLRLRLELTPDAGVAACTADLLVRETACCSFFAFSLSTGPGTLTLDVAVPAEYADVLDAVADRATR